MGESREDEADLDELESPEDGPEAEHFDDPGPSTVGRAGRWLVRNGWLLAAVGAGLVLTKVVEFQPPEQVRIDEASVDLVGEAPAQEFDAQLANPQAVQMRATLRLYPRADLDVREPDPQLDAKARVLSQPVVTTIYAMNANIEQTVRLDDGELEIDVALAGTPRLGDAGRNQVPPLTLEQELTVSSREKQWLGEPVERVHLHTRGTLADIEERPYRWVFVIEGKLFALDLELHRAI